jgi:cell division protein FtsQ
MTIDPRLAERRREVAEDRARRKVSRLLKFLIAIGLVGAGVWLLLSPLLSVEEVITSGIGASSADEVLANSGVVPGTPLILIRSGEIESLLEDDPWVGAASVDLDWPNRVVVTIEERLPVAWLETEDGWGFYAVDGVQLGSAPEPDPSLPWIELGTTPSTETQTSPVVLGTLEFVAALSGELGEGARLWAEGNGELWAEVAGFQVRLGRPVEMRAKALSLTALLREQPAPGSILTLIAPTNPAVSAP